ncbi:MAG TPA: ABC-F family ATP-binding cassette domain-containing protein [Ignavibacteriales bacterium]|nr:ABC-F family ATP-binding cassette domain-containing protein [Ignavibacteriales bacterium]HOL81130.1 ABC-F family ATP-binding cassette domain-containing protein [Ignavibacteriales bacterium]HOM65233.1 ABC-F family ATP-binding cassette domain-containing protein [Ignavibacteriales bacterium]HPD66525.1 ABC-F family ATP-binding cassette domain-containing protein [Ignavibacteriales bacterium]HPP33514.1 ABC-F family ATP-binding cassette domain-containing protein [Ignavibacteriales bacterium]
MIDIIDLSVQFGGKYLFQNVNLKINKNDKIALVGSNGAGKSTFLKVLLGEIQPETGKVHKRKNLAIGYLPQEFINHSQNTLFNEVFNSHQTLNYLKTKEVDLNNLLNETTDEYERLEIIEALGEIHNQLEFYNEEKIKADIEKILIGLGFNEKDFTRTVDEFSGGWQMRIELAKILSSYNDIILFDEPTNHLDIDTLQWLIDFLKSYNGALIVISHDIYFVNSVTNRTLEIFANKMSFFNGTYNQYLNFKKERDEQLYKQYELQQKKIEDTKKFIDRFRYKATKAKQVQSRIKQLEKIELIELPDYENHIKIKFPPPDRIPKVLISLENVTKFYDDVLVFKDINFTIEKNDKIAVVGPNGAGKSTLTKILTNSTDITSGRIIKSELTEISYFSQDVTEYLDAEQTVFDNIYFSGVDLNLTAIRTLLGSFLFSDDDIEKKVKVLSGGEKNRLALCKMLLSSANLIILDEPTNHLDVNSKRVLQEALIDFSGAVLIVSHDVDFLRPIANKVLELRDHNAKLFVGGIDYYLEKRQQNKLETQTQKEKISKDDNILNKKDIKRIEAEIRQKKYREKKEYQEKYEKIEKEIQIIEEKINQIENFLANPENYNDHNKILNANQELLELKEKYDNLFINWTELSEILENIEEKYQKELSELIK